jgi:hypothetical protein
VLGIRGAPGRASDLADATIRSSLPQTSLSETRHFFLGTFSSSGGANGQAHGWMCQSRPSGLTDRSQRGHAGSRVRTRATTVTPRELWRVVVQTRASRTKAPFGGDWANVNIHTMSVGFPTLLMFWAKNSETPDAGSKPRYAATTLRRVPTRRGIWPGATNAATFGTPLSRCAFLSVRKRL